MAEYQAEQDCNNKEKQRIQEMIEQVLSVVYSELQDTPVESIVPAFHGPFTPQRQRLFELIRTTDKSFTDCLSIVAKESGLPSEKNGQRESETHALHTTLEQLQDKRRNKRVLYPGAGKDMTLYDASQSLPITPVYMGLETAFPDGPPMEEIVGDLRDPSAFVSVGYNKENLFDAILIKGQPPILTFTLHNITQQVMAEDGTVIMYTGVNQPINDAFHGLIKRNMSLVDGIGSDLFSVYHVNLHFKFTHSCLDNTFIREVALKYVYLNSTFDNRQPFPSFDQTRDYLKGAFISTIT